MKLDHGLLAPSPIVFSSTTVLPPGTTNFDSNDPAYLAPCHDALPPPGELACLSHGGAHMADSTFAFLNSLFPWNKPSTPAPTPTPAAAGTSPLRPDKGKSPVPGPRASSHARTLDSVVEFLPVLGKVAAQLGDTFPKTDPRYAFAVNLETAAYALEDLLAAVGRLQDSTAFEHDIIAVADCLEDLLAIASRPRPREFDPSATVVPTLPPLLTLLSGSGTDSALAIGTATTLVSARSLCNRAACRGSE